MFRMESLFPQQLLGQVDLSLLGGDGRGPVEFFHEPHLYREDASQIGLRSVPQPGGERQRPFLGERLPFPLHGGHLIQPRFRSQPRRIPEHLQMIIKRLQQRRPRRRPLFLQRSPERFQLFRDTARKFLSEHCNL